ncbi:hypothetical protein ABFA07_011884 [Porites harrisoni]
MAPVAASFIFVIAGLLVQVSGTNVGDCNVTYFISQGYECQGQMISNLKNNPSTNCSYEYENEKTCMKNHIAGCLTGNLGAFIDPVTSLLIHQVYHCGDLKYKPSFINDRILDMIKCSQNAFMDTDFCWRYFREKLNANRSDPSLCGEYAVAKECILEKAKVNCQICQEFTRDTFNPFCPNNTDPEMHLYGCEEIKKPLTCSPYTVYKVARDCEKNLLKAFLVDKAKADCGATYTALKNCLDEQLARMCKDDTKNPRVASSVRKAVLAVLRGHRFFCEPPVNLRAVDLDYKARPLYPCSEEFLNEMEKCATPMRKEFKSPDSTFTKLCRHFRTAVDCSNNAQKSYCTFDKQDRTRYPISLHHVLHRWNPNGRKYHKVNCNIFLSKQEPITVSKPLFYYLCNMLNVSSW